MNIRQSYNTGKAIDRDELISLIKDAKNNDDWSKVELANVSEIDDMSHLFYEVEGIENLNLDGWDTSNVEDMYSMFSKSNYNHPLDFDTFNVKDMENIFDGASPITFKGGNVPDNVKDFIDETNVAYEEKLSIEAVVKNNQTIIRTLKL